MATADIRVVFFDLGDTLGTAVLSDPDHRLSGFDVFPFVPSLLGQLKSRSLQLGIISNTGDEPGTTVDRVLASAGIQQFFDAGLRLYSKDVGMKKDSPAIFTLAATRAGLSDRPQCCLFVGEDPQERDFAGQAGMRVCPHPLLVPEVLAEQPLRFARVAAPPAVSARAFRAALRARALVPLHVTGREGRTVYVMTSDRVVAELANMRLGVDLLGEPGAPAASELYLIRDDVARESGYLSPQGQSGHLFDLPHARRLVVSATQEGLVVALPPGRFLRELHFKQARHGHTVKMMPDPSLLDEPDGQSPGPLFTMALDAVPTAAAPDLTPAELGQLTSINSGAIRDRIDRYSGQAAMTPGTAQRIASRHINSRDNSPAVEAMARELQAIGQGRLTVRRHRFSHRGQTLENIEAELAGRSSELVLVTAHLDSTAANSPDYDEEHHKAPGADDDASGVAAVLTIAERIVAMSAGAPPGRTIRFVLFNAEEEGLVGSRAYARHQRSIGAPIMAVFQMDMIAYNQTPPRAWEVHAGYAASLEVENRSVALANLLRQVTQRVSPKLEPPEIYQTGGDQEADPAAGRSDHASFQAYGYAACVASEDFFVPLGSNEPPPDENPHYHTTDDEAQYLDFEFAADIARAVGATAWLAAR